MGAPDTIIVRQYEASITLLAQQMDTYLKHTVMFDSNFKAEKKFYDQYNANAFTQISTFYADTQNSLPDYRRRMVTPNFYTCSILEEPILAHQMITDPKGTIYQASLAGANRQIDDTIIASYVATAYTGKDGTTTQAFTSGNQITSGSTGMTKTKLIKARRLLDKAEVERADRFAVHGSSQLDDLLNQTEVTNSDYNVVKALVQAELDTWLGFKFVRTERLLTNGSSERLCYLYQKKAYQLAIQQDIMGRLDERPDKNYAWQIYMKLALGATRLEEARTVEMACVEAS
jgi:hypothetical protein